MPEKAFSQAQREYLLLCKLLYVCFKMERNYVWHEAVQLTGSERRQVAIVRLNVNMYPTE